MFPCAFDEMKSAGVNHEGIGSVLSRSFVLVQVVSALSLELIAMLMLNGRALNGCDWKMCYAFIRYNQVEGVARKVKLRRVLLEMPALREKSRQDLSLVLHQSR